MSLAGTAAAVGLWLLLFLLAYAAVAAVVLFYLPPADRLPSGTLADVAFAVTVPVVLLVTWLRAARGG
ncbi:MAG: hypothetical protein ABEJ92_00750 [Halobacteriales archaeon]